MAEKPLRHAMPTVAAWIDELRDAFGAEGINAAIRNGVHGGTHFYAHENGQCIGSEGAPTGVAICTDRMVLRKAGEADR